MKVSSVGLGLVSGIISAGIFLPAVAQVTSDGTTNTTVNTNGNDFTILNGIEKGNNLFHSFSDFSVPTGGSAKFDLVNTPNITTIFSRVTGGNISNIDGLIQTVNGNNSASLFLMNPNGIVFGQNASLNIGGSFFGTTANSIKFSDGSEFSAVNPNQPPLLTMSVPVGLQMGSNPGAIRVQGRGHNLTYDSVRFPQQFYPPFKRETNPTGLTVQAGKTLALVGGDVFLEGGQLLAEKGRIELGSVSSGLVNLFSKSSGFVLGYEGISNFQDIQLSQQALADASGADGDGINFIGRQIALADGSVALINNPENTASGKIAINASESLKLIGTTPDGTVQSSLTNETIGAGNVGGITVATKNLILEDGGQILTRTFGTGAGGDIIVDALDSAQAISTAPLNPLFFSSIFAIGSNGSFGKAGDLTISTRELTVLNGGIISASSFGNGAGGNLTIQAADSVELIGKDPLFDSPSDVNVGSYRSGNGGNLIIDTQRLVVRDGAAVRASTIGGGDAGSITVNASQSVEVRGKSSIEASVDTGSSVNTVIGIKANLSGQAGGVTLNTENLIVTDEGKVTVRNLGQANGGTLRVNADSILLDRQGTLSASTASGESGNINLQVVDAFVLRNQSQILAEAGGTGNGGNITINSPIILGLENSDIIANAVEGNGGNIDITTQGIFGLEFRDQLTEENDITASSEFGVNGTVNINNFGVDPSSGILELPVTTTDKSQQIARGCADTSGSSFIATGRGGIPENPNQDINSDRTWSDVRDISAYRQEKPVTAKIPAPANPVIQATSWRRNQQGEVELIAENSSTQVQQSLTCAALSQS